MYNRRNTLKALACALLASTIPSLVYGQGDDGGRHHGHNHFQIEVLSTKPYLVTGGGAVCRVTVKESDGSLSSVRIELNGSNVTGSFRADAGARALTGLLS